MQGGLAGEHVVPCRRAEGCAHLDTQVEGLATEDLGVDRTHEFGHTVEPFRAGRLVSQSTLPSGERCSRQRLLRSGL